MVLKCILLRERTQSRKATYCVIPYGKDETVVVVKRFVNARSLQGALEVEWVKHWVFSS